MKRHKGKNKNRRQGAALVIAMMFLAIFSSLALAMLTMSSTNVQVADNHCKANRALESAQSGFEVMNYWLGRVNMPGTVAPGDRFTNLASYVNNDLATVGISVANTYDDGGYPAAVSLGNIAINSLLGQSFLASIQKTENLDVLQLDVTGNAGNLTRIIRVNYNFGTREHNVFDYGVASRGPLSLVGNIEMSGTNVAVEADVYIRK